MVAVPPVRGVAADHPPGRRDPAGTKRWMGGEARRYMTLETMAPLSNNTTVSLPAMAV